MASTATQICNLACDAVPTAGITSLSEGSFTAKVCARQYPQALAELLELTDWGFGRQRIALTALVTNDRPDQWAYAYARPPGVFLAARVYQDPGAVTGSGLLAGQVPSVYDRIAQLEIPFEDGGEVIWTNTPDAMLEFIGDTAASLFSPSFTAALACKIAQRICLPITKNQAFKQRLDGEVEVLVARAITINMNRNPKTWGNDFIPESILARSQNQ